MSMPLTTHTTIIILHVYISKENMHTIFFYLYRHCITMRICHTINVPMVIERGCKTMLSLISVLYFICHHFSLFHVLSHTCISTYYMTNHYEQGLSDIYSVFFIHVQGCIISIDSKFLKSPRCCSIYCTQLMLIINAKYAKWR